MSGTSDSPSTTEYNGGGLLVTSVFLLTTTTISVALRFFIRIRITKGLEWDDWLMLVSQCIFVTSCTFILIGLRYGMGHHNAFLPVPQQVEALKYQVLATMTYIADMMFIKLSIGFFLLRLAIQRRYAYILWTTMVIVFIWSTVLFFWDVFLCTPVAAQWDFRILDQTCASPEAQISAAYSLSVLCILTDWLYALLPIAIIWNIQMDLTKRLAVVGILALGVFASVATIIRLTFLANLVQVDDILYAGTDPMIWTLVEPGVAIIAGSLVTIRPMLRALGCPGFRTRASMYMADHHSLTFRYVSPLEDDNVQDSAADGQPTGHHAALSKASSHSGVRTLTGNTSLGSERAILN